MLKHRFCRSWPVPILGLVMALIQPASANANTSANLLVNGDAELQLCTNDWTAQTSIPGWRVVRGAASVLCYSAFNFTNVTPATPSNVPAGNALFAAPGADTAMEQSVDVSAAATAIDSGTVAFTLSGWLGGWANRPERATLTAVFLNASGQSTGAPVVIADVDAQARGNVTGLVQRAVDGVVPPSTRQITVTVQFLSGMTSFQNAYADNISLTLTGSVTGLAPAAATPPASSIPALDHVYVLMMENTNYADVIATTGNTVTIDPQMPFFASLAKSGVILSNMWETYHPSDQNYVAMIAGNTYRYGPVYYPDYDLPVSHLGDLLNAQGKSWSGDVQDMITPCNLASIGQGETSFSPDDEPFVQFKDVIDNRARCVADIRDLKDFTAAIASNTLPNFAWLAADNWWDGEGAWYENYDQAFSNAKQDEFLQSALQPLVDSPQFQQSRSLLIVTWDEADGWGWPDDHVATILVGSPGLLQAGTVLHKHVNGYDLLRTIESALGTGSLGRFDQFAVPLNEAFAGDETPDIEAGYLWPTQAVATRGSINDTFGTATTPAAVDQGKPLTLVVPAGVDSTIVATIEPLGQVPTATSPTYHFNSDNLSIAIPTTQLAPGVYGVWLQRGTAPPSLAPMMATILPPALVTPSNPGVEIVGASTSGNPANVGQRYGSNPIVRYCRPSGAAPANTWIGVFAAGTPSSQMTQANADVIGFWLKTPGGGGESEPCGEAEAYASELTPGQEYEVLLFQNAANGKATAVGRTAAFTVTPALPQ
jgi:Phosphoesterase family